MVIYRYANFQKNPKDAKQKMRVFVLSEKEGGKKKKRTQSLSCMIDTGEIIIFNSSTLL